MDYSKAGTLHQQVVHPLPPENTNVSSSDQMEIRIRLWDVVLSHSVSSLLTRPEQHD